MIKFIKGYLTYLKAWIIYKRYEHSGFIRVSNIIRGPLMLPYEYYKNTRENALWVATARERAIAKLLEPQAKVEKIKGQFIY